MSDFNRSPSGKGGLGRGLSALIPCDEYDVSAVEDGATERNVVAVESLRAGRFQPRKRFSEEELQGLAVSIKTNGLINPILVRERADGEEKHEIIAGERRWRASIIAGLQEVPVIIRNVSDKTAIEFAIIENVQREDLNPIEEAEAYKELLEKHRYTHEDLSSILGKSRSHITNIVRLLSLPEKVKSLLRDGKLSMGHARAMINIQNVDQILDRVFDGGLNVRQTESLIKSLQKTGALSQGEKKKGGGMLSPSFQSSLMKMENCEEKSPEIIALENQLSERLSLGVSISERAEGGELIIKYKTLEDLEFLLEKLVAL